MWHVIIHLVAFSASVFVIKRLFGEDYGGRVAKIFALAYLIRAGFILCLHQFSQNGFFFYDDVGYHEQGQLIAFGKNIGPLSEALGTFHIGYPALIGWLYSVADRSVLSGKLLNALFGALLIPIAFAICRQLWPSDKDAAFRSAWVVALFPSAIAWSGFLLKDITLELIFAAIILLTLIAIQKQNVWASLGLFAALYIASLFRFYAVAIWSVALLCSGLAYLVRRFIPKCRIAAFCGIAAGSAVLSWFVFFWIAGSLEVLQPIVGFYTAAITADDVTLLQPSVAAFGRAVFVYFLGPFPWVFSGFDQVNYVFFPGMYVTYAMFPIAAVGFWKQVRHLDPMKVFAFAPIILLAAIEIYFFQGAPRQRLMCESLFCLCFAVAWPVRQEFSRFTKLSYATLSLVAAGHVLVNL